MYPMDVLVIVAALQLAAHIQTPTTIEIVINSLGCCHIANRMKKPPTAHKQLHCTYEPTTTIPERLLRHDQMDSSQPREEELNVSQLVKRLPEPSRR